MNWLLPSARPVFGAMPHESGRIVFLGLVDRPLGGAMVSAMGALEKALPGLAAGLLGSAHLFEHRGRR